MEKVHKCNVKKEKGYLYFVDGSGDIARVKQGQTGKEVVCKNDNAFKKEVGWMYFVDKSGDVSRAKMKSFKGWAEVRDEAPGQLLVEKDWIAGAIKHPGRCTPFPNPDCPKDSPQGRLAQRFKKGDLHKK